MTRDTMIAHCPCCGMNFVDRHSKYADRCVDCGKRFSRYANYKYRARQGDTKAERLLDQIVLDYKILKQAGYKVPKDIK